MVKLSNGGVFLKNGKVCPENENIGEIEKIFKNPLQQKAALRNKTITYQILNAHNTADEGAENMAIDFDCLCSHDITYVNIVQSARAAGLTEFAKPYVLTCCHNSLCAVGGTINADDHAYGLSCAKKYGGIFVPPHIAVIHQYMREEQAASGKMYLGSDSHTRYGPLGALGVGEGGGELLKQLLGAPYAIAPPDVTLVYLTGAPPETTGPMDAALSIIKAVCGGFVKNKCLEFIGPGVLNLSADYRLALDVMTTEMGCLTSVWQTDGAIKKFFDSHGRAEDFKQIDPPDLAYYDGCVYVDLSGVKSVVALPAHPGNVYAADEFLNNAAAILNEIEKNASMPLDLKSHLTKKGFYVDQGVIAGCAGGTFETLCAAADILSESGPGLSPDFPLSVYPASLPVYSALLASGRAGALTDAGAVIKTAFCGPCFGAGDTPQNGGVSLRHTTRNFPYREGAKPKDGQSAGVILADGKTVAQTGKNGGLLAAPRTGASRYAYTFNKKIYEGKVYNGRGKPSANYALKIGPNITDWPEFRPLLDGEHLLFKVVSFIDDAVTTTDEIIPSGETSSLRSNPIKLSEFTLSRRDPDYVKTAKEAAAAEAMRRSGETNALCELDAALSARFGASLKNTRIASLIYFVCPGEGSAREQAASCQRVLGTLANIAKTYATKRYRSNLINWGIIPFVFAEAPPFAKGDYIFVPDLARRLQNGSREFPAFCFGGGGSAAAGLTLLLPGATADERACLVAGAFLNMYNANRK